MYLCEELLKIFDFLIFSFFTKKFIACAQANNEMFSLDLLYLSRIRRHAFIDSLSTLFCSFRSAVLSSWYSFGYILPIVFVFLYRSCRVFERDEFVESPRRLRVVNGDILFCFGALIFFELRWCGFPLNDASATSSPTDGFVFIFVKELLSSSEEYARCRTLRRGFGPGF